jgi:hypothetical protein
MKTQIICPTDAHFPEYADLFTDMFGASSVATPPKKMSLSS